MHRLSQIILFLLIPVCISAQSPHGNGFSIDCADCHTANSWSVNTAAMKFNHAATSFQLEGQHKLLACNQCHTTKVFSQASRECAGCHSDIHQNSVGINCGKCHNTTSWIISNPLQLHQATRFPLLGLHAKADCISCHPGYKQYNFSVQGITCVSCHANDYYGAKSPNHVAAGFSKTCADCHQITSTTWGSAGFSHSFFPLVPPHKIDNCYACHTKSTFQGLNSSCYSCHAKDYNAVVFPSHTKSGFSTSCQSCHAGTDWKNANFDHSQTPFPLTGKHTTTNCADCHINNLATPSTLCYSCHSSEYAKTNDPNHLANGYPTTCGDCHTTNGWGTSSFDHSKSGFVLTGAHLNTTCAQCHQSGYQNTPTDCKSCHLAKMNAATNPDHKLSNFPQACTTCHNTTAWSPTLFNHANTQFNLVGAHVSTPCNSCHVSVYAGTSKTCSVCHHDKVAVSQTVNHSLGNFPTACDNCHSTTQWKPSSFNHATTQFQLTGTHLTTTCNACHVSVYAGTSKTCSVCHHDKVAVSQTVNHSLGNFPTACDNCHSTTQWKPSSFNHATTQFQLTGTHLTTTCNACHTTQYSGTAKVCAVCHNDKINVSQTVNHALGNFPTSCEGCHSTSAWKPSTFSHAATQFPLTGKHTTTSCNDCHKTVYATTSTVCYSCHQDAYNGSKNPAHVTGGYPTTCADCHATTAWVPASFDHATKGFTLLGVHATTACTGCHASGFPNTPTDCKGCHLTNYQNSSNPAHVTLGLSTDCATCHKTIALGWKPADFPQHANYFAFQGAHIVIAANCSSCHNGTYPNTPKVCSGCHLTNYNNSVNPPHVQLSFSQDCSTCHNQTAWAPAPSYAHPTYDYKVKHSTKKCSDCHSLSAYYPQCISCHQTQFSNDHKATDNKDCWKSGCHPNTNSFDRGKMLRPKQRLEIQ